VREQLKTERGPLILPLPQEEDPTERSRPTPTERSIRFPQSGLAAMGARGEFIFDQRERENEMNEILE